MVREPMRCLEGTSNSKEKRLVDPSSKETVAVSSLCLVVTLQLQKL